MCCSSIRHQFSHFGLVLEQTASLVDCRDSVDLARRNLPNRFANANRNRKPHGSALHYLRFRRGATEIAIVSGSSWVGRMDAHAR